MPKFMQRAGSADLNTNPYYNSATFVGAGGYYKGNNDYECVNYAMGRTCELAEEKCTFQFLLKRCAVKIMSFRCQDLR